MKPEELLDPTKYPEDLRWLVERFNLPPHDPVFLLLAWHHRKLAGTEDSLKLRTMELKAALDARAEKIEKAAATIEPINGALEALLGELRREPLTLTRRLEAELKEPVADAVRHLAEMDRTLSASLAAARGLLGEGGRRQALAALIAGFAAGMLAASLCWMS